jgi:pantoate--beta-alanine ligase
LNFIKNNLQKGSLLQLIANARTKLHEQSFKVDYIEIVDAATLQPVNEWDGKERLVVLAAAFLNEVRLIDNMVLNS